MAEKLHAFAVIVEVEVAGLCPRGFECGFCIFILVYLSQSIGGLLSGYPFGCKSRTYLAPSPKRKPGLVVGERAGEP